MSGVQFNARVSKANFDVELNMVSMNVYTTRGNEIFLSRLVFLSIAVVACTGTGLDLFAFEHHESVSISCRGSPVPNYSKHHPQLSFLGNGLLQL